MVVVGPVTWLGLGMIGGIRGLAAGVDAGQLPIPLPSEAVKNWPIIGERAHELWSLAANNIKVALAQLLPMLKPLGIKLLDLAQGALFSLLELLISIVIAGFLFARGPQLVDALSTFVGRVLSQRATIRNVSQGVVGISMLQAVLAGAGFLAAGIPAPGVLAFVALVLAIVQIGPAFLFLPVVVWSWAAMDTTHALIFTAYMVPVGLLDSILKPVLMARGLTTPMPVIMVGVIGGTIAYGIVGLFFGPIVLSVAWAVMTTWVRGSEAPEEHNFSQQKV